jgi:uncharacterized membrane protein YfcA
VIAGIVMLVGGAAVGLFGSLLGLGGGILLVPLLTLGFGRPLREAVAVSLVSVIVTSSAGAGVYLRRHVANLRLGMVLELFTAIGALAGGLIAFLLPVAVLQALFAILLTWVAVSMLRRRGAPGRAPVVPDEDVAVAVPGVDGALGTLAETAAAAAPTHVTATATAPAAAPASRPTPALRARPDLATTLSGQGYRVTRLRFGMAGAVGAGVVSALLGVGGGIIKVPVMHLAMGVPLKVATATSNMMIGITATSSAVMYLLRDQINPYVAGPVAVGVFLGASFGSRVINRVDVRFLRWLFVVVLLVTATQMAIKAVGL